MRADGHKALLLAVLMLATGLAGCTGGDGPGTDGGDGSDDQGPPTAEIPRWELGDAWTYTIDTHGFPESESTLLYYGTDEVNCEEDGQNYCVGATEEEQALIHALFNVNPQLGRIQKGNLAVYEDGEPRAMYDFPLQDGDSWQTRFFVSQHGGTLAAEATYSDSIETGIGAMEGFEITATNPQGFEVVYDYIPEIQWFSKLVVTDEDGTTLHDLRLADFQRGASGTGYFVRGDDLSEETFTNENCGFPTGCTRSVLVDGASAKDGKYGGYDLVAYNVQVKLSDPDNDRAQIEIRDGDGETVYERQFTLESQEDEFRFETVRDFAPGQWEIQVSVTGGAEAQVRLAGAWSYSGSV